MDYSVSHYIDQCVGEPFKSNTISEATQKTLDKLKKEGVPQKAYVYENHMSYNNGKWVGEGFRIDVCDSDTSWYICASFKTSVAFEFYLRKLGVSIVEEIVHNADREYQHGGKMTELHLDKYILRERIGFWKLSELPFYEETIIHTSDHNTWCRKEGIDHQCTLGWTEKHRFPVMENGGLCWGYVQSTDDAVIIHHPNCNSELFQRIPYDYRNPPVIF